MIGLLIAYACLPLHIFSSVVTYAVVAPFYGSYEDFDADKQPWVECAIPLPDGGLLLHYRKINPWPWAEQAWASEGDFGNVFVDTPYGRMGLLICYDMNFEPPNLKKLGIDHLLYSIAWVDARDSAWFPERLPQIARENNLNIIGANWTVPPDSKPAWHGYGNSLIINNQGRTVSKVYQDTTEEIIYAELKVPQKVDKPPPKDNRKESSK